MTDLTLTYPPQLPVSDRHDEIMAAIEANQVVIIAGETGSGKTTQIPKMCLELGRGLPVERTGKDGRKRSYTRQIGHTQPRRLAARTIAERLAVETNTKLGEQIGYQVRFTDHTDTSTRVKVMTDGILLAEIRRDRRLMNYDTIIIDEAHERSLNIDFLLGYLKRLLPKRRDLKLIITSATIDVDRFSKHFDEAPVIEVSGRTFPVEIRYRPPEKDEEPLDAMLAATDELMLEPDGDILVFFPTEADIREAAKALAGRHRFTEVLTLFGRLSAADQHKVFETGRAPGIRRRIVLSTNVAETSLTVPGIRYVIDTGTARISRYSTRSRVQRLPVEAISQASANQRAGRCGRVAEGICIRLYSEDDYMSRPEYTDPEILRTNLASVILQMATLKVGAIDDFPFLQPPDARAVASGIDTLVELRAIESPKASRDGEMHITDIGRQLARVPIDPRLGRMIVEAQRLGVAHEVTVIVAALTVQDPRERPRDRQQAADQQHARFVDPSSDFLGTLKLWKYLEQQRHDLSSSAFRRLCHKEFINYVRVREWIDLVRQLERMQPDDPSSFRIESAAAANDTTRTAAVGERANDRGHTKSRHGSNQRSGRRRGDDATTEAADGIHRALMAGLLSQLGVYDEKKRNYLGSRGTRFWVFPGSGLFKKPPTEVMTAELVETERLWARVNAKVDLGWAEELAGDLAKHSYAQPRWSAKREQVVATERVTLYGVPIVAGRRANYGRVDPELARELFIRQALVEGDWHTRHAFFAENQRLRAHVEDLENRSRRRDIAIDDEALFAFYDHRIPAEINTGRAFDRWWKQQRRETPELLTLSIDDVTDDRAQSVDETDYPNTWRQGDLTLAVSYRFDPGSDSDGVNVDVPLALLAQLRPEGFDWLVPGLREDLAVALIRSLPKVHRRNVVPAADWARRALETLPHHPDGRPFAVALGAALRSLSGVPIPDDAWEVERVPAHLRATFRVLDEQGRAISESTDLLELQREHHDSARVAVAARSSANERTGLTAWASKPGDEAADRGIGALPVETVEDLGGNVVRSYPALVDEGRSVAVRLFAAPGDALRSHWAGVRRLVALNVPMPTEYVLKHLTGPEKLALASSPYRSPRAAIEDAALAVIDAHLAELVLPNAAGHTAGADLQAGASGASAGSRERARLLHLAEALPRDPQAFEQFCDRVSADLVDALFAATSQVAKVLGAQRDTERALKQVTSMALLGATSGIRAHIEQLVYEGFIRACGTARLPHIARYLEGLALRLHKLEAQPGRDNTWRAEADTALRLFEGAGGSIPSPDWWLGVIDERSRVLDEARWMLEELQVGLWAQELGTASAASVPRLKKLLAKLPK